MSQQKTLEYFGRIALCFQIVVNIFFVKNCKNLQRIFPYTYVRLNDRASVTEFGF